MNSCYLVLVHYYHYHISVQMNIAAKCLKALSGLFSPNLTDQLPRRSLTTQAKTRSILHNDWSSRLGENRPDQILLTFGGYAVNMYTFSL